jgi:hypothetical protein
MTLAEDLLLIAVGPRDGRIRSVERIGIALRAVELVELTLAKRITVGEHRIAVIDPAPTDHPCLDRALASLHGSGGSALGDWLEQRPAGPGMIRQYMSLLTDQGMIRVEQRGHGDSASTRIVVLDHERCAQALTRSMQHAYQSQQAQHAGGHSASSSGHSAGHAGGGGHH